MEERHARAIDAYCKIATALVLIVGGYFTAKSYITNREAQTKSAAIEAKKPFLQKQLDTYVDVSSTLAVLVTSKDPSELAKAKEHFGNLYWGPMRVVQDAFVGASMDSVAKCLDQKPQCPTLENLATELTLNCHYSLVANWDLVPPAAPTNPVVTVQ